MGPAVSHINLLLRFIFVNIFDLTKRLGAKRLFVVGFGALSKTTHRRF
jgi:hypothetical protein